MHEKSILLPLMPLCLLAPSEPLLAAWLPAVATFSMFPLLKKDGLGLCYAALLLLWAALPHRLSEEGAAEKGKVDPSRPQCPPEFFHLQRCELLWALISYLWAVPFRQCARCHGSPPIPNLT